MISSNKNKSVKRDCVESWHRTSLSVVYVCQQEVYKYVVFRKCVVRVYCEEVQQIPIDMTLFAAGWSEWDKLYISRFWADASLATCQPTESELHQRREVSSEGICSELSGDK